MGKEIELKYSVPCAEDIEIIQKSELVLKNLSGEFLTIEMHATYYDTDDSLLSKKGISLRKRMENGVSVYTVKTSISKGGALASRGEWQVNADSIPSALSLLRENADIPEYLFEICKNHRLCPCAETVFTRKTAPLAFGAELCLDAGYLSGVEFYELEIELTTCSALELIDFGTRLSEEFSLQPQPKSKLHRAREYYFKQKGIE